MAPSSKYPGVKRLPSGGIEYRGKKFAGFNKPRKSDRPEKKGMVLAKEGDTIKLIHYGAKGYGHNYSPTARASLLKAAMEKILVRVSLVLLIGPIKYYGLDRASLKKVHQKLRNIRSMVRGSK
jgi:hypothetical protein